MSEPAHVAALRRRLELRRGGSRQLLAVPGCWDGLTGLLVAQAGAEAAFLTGGGLSMARLGRPDLGLVTASELVEATMTIRDRIELPLIVDADTGFGGPDNVRRTTRLLERAGASAIQIEDQTFPKRCGHMSGKAVVPLSTAVARVEAALEAREHMLIVARTDAAGVAGLDEAMARAEAFLEAGADLIFIEGPPTLADMQRVAKTFAPRVPLVHNLVAGGVSAVSRSAELEALGFAIALHPLLLMHGLIDQGPRLLAEMLAERRTGGFNTRIADLERINGLLTAPVARGEPADG